MPLAPTLAAHGARIPAIGFGTSGLGDVRAEHVAAALKAGYRHIDTARKYGTERAVGQLFGIERGCGGKPRHQTDGGQMVGSNRAGPERPYHAAREPRIPLPWRGEPRWIMR